MAELARRFGRLAAGLVLATALLWALVLIVLPQALMVEISFRPNLPAAARGGPEDVWTLANYGALWSNPLHRTIFWQTIWSSLLVTALALLVCYPVAWYLAQRAQGTTALLLATALVIPFWVNEILRTFSWFLILARNGLVNRLLLGLGLIEEPLALGGVGAVMIGMVYAYVLFMIFPLYNALESLDRNQIEAARDLGAPTWRIHWRVVIPHAKPGIAVGCVMTFMLAAGTFAVPQIMQSLPGGTNARWFTQIIYSYFFDGGDWNRGSAYAFALLLLCILFVVAMMRLFRVGLADVAK
ncbi:MAG: ABC transporter permease [Geminicoccaceae bacterium]|nr:ABC transporter permease [Geminicoccaceae bacterium]MCX8102601.1 ABC transporter permease [Geminicoccaceae bacterium]MDW8371472.1 ABC transporter permease [Geminicoccaceae bacterium]